MLKDLNISSASLHLRWSFSLSFPITRTLGVSGLESGQDGGWLLDYLYIGKGRVTFLCGTKRAVPFDRSDKAILLLKKKSPDANVYCDIPPKLLSFLFISQNEFQYNKRVNE